MCKKNSARCLSEKDTGGKRPQPAIDSTRCKIIYMICIKTVKKYCSEDISKIENYEQAVNDKTQTWHCHHRAEILPCGRYKQAVLKQFGLYWNRPADELIFMLDIEHQKMHHIGQRVLHGRRWYSNGKESILAYESPGVIWSDGRICRRSSV